MNILVVDDNSINVKVMCKMAEMEHAICDTAYSAKEAIAKVQQKSYQLVFMDVQMPDINGLSCSKIIKQLLGINAPLIYLLTGSEISALDKELLSFVDNVYQKPMRLAVLKGLLENAKAVLAS